MVDSIISINKVENTQKPQSTKKNYIPFYLLSGTGIASGIGQTFFNNKIEKDILELDKYKSEPELGLKRSQEIEKLAKKGNKIFNIVTLSLLGASVLALIFAPKKQS